MVFSTKKSPPPPPLLTISFLSASLNWIEQSSIVTDVSHPAVWNFIHDWMYRTGMGGLESDVIYREIMILGGISKFKAYRRYYVIRVAWLLYFKRKHKKSGNVRDLSDNCVLLYNSLK